MRPTSVKSPQPGVPSSVEILKKTKWLPSFLEAPPLLSLTISSVLLITVSTLLRPSLEITASLLVPVPLHRRRLFSRRYNQAALLAQTLGRLSGKRVMVDALARVRQTSPLAGQSPTERRQAVADAIRARPHRVRALSGRRVVLVDDVLTTGATAGVCTEALLAAGAASVDVLAAARAAGFDVLRATWMGEAPALHDAQEREGRT